MSELKKPKIDAALKFTRGLVILLIASLIVRQSIAYIVTHSPGQQLLIIMWSLFVLWVFVKLNGLWHRYRNEGLKLELRSQGDGK